jgi:uncharacterized protein DUF433
MSEFPRITRDPKVMGGKSCIRGMRVTVGMIAEGATPDQLLKEFPRLPTTYSYEDGMAGATPTPNPSPQVGGE